MKSTSSSSSAAAAKRYSCAAGTSSHLTAAQVTTPIVPCAPVSRRKKSVWPGPLGSACTSPPCHCASSDSGPVPASPVNMTSPLPHTTPQLRSGSGRWKL